MAMNIWQITPFTRGLLELKKQQPLNQNRMNYIDLNSIIEYWTKKKHEGDKGGTFNLQLYLQYLKAKSNEIQQR
jgi:hypothetical protein